MSQGRITTPLLEKLETVCRVACERMHGAEEWEVAKYWNRGRGMFAVLAEAETKLADTLADARTIVGFKQDLELIEISVSGLFPEQIEELERIEELLDDPRNVLEC